LQPDVAAPLVIFFRQQALPIWLAWFDIGFDVVIANGGMELPVLWGCAQGAFRPRFRAGCNSRRYSGPALTEAPINTSPAVLNTILRIKSVADGFIRTSPIW
jgi:hypothetical protein